MKIIKNRTCKNCKTISKVKHTYYRNTKRTKRKGVDELFEIMTESFPKLVTDTKLQVKKAQRTSSRINTKKHTLRCIIIKL